MPIGNNEIARFNYYYHHASMRLKVAVIVKPVAALDLTVDVCIAFVTRCRIMFTMILAVNRRFDPKGPKIASDKSAFFIL